MEVETAPSPVVVRSDRRGDCRPGRGPHHPIHRRHDTSVPPRDHRRSSGGRRSREESDPRGVGSTVDDDRYRRIREAAALATGTAFWPACRIRTTVSRPRNPPRERQNTRIKYNLLCLLPSSGWGAVVTTIRLPHLRVIRQQCEQVRVNTRVDTTAVAVGVPTPARTPPRRSWSRTDADPPAEGSVFDRRRTD